MSGKSRIGIIGCGNIVANYLKNAKTFEILDIAFVADLLPERAQKVAAEFGVPKAGTPEQLLADPSIDIVVNLTIPAAHAQVALAALEAGKHVYNEKPLAVTREDGRKILELANRKNLRVGGAPDTFLGAGHQTARKLIDDGAIGRPVSALAFMMGRGPDLWHPDPENFYKAGGGPMFDMGPYYLTWLINLLGPAKRLSASAGILMPNRVAGTGPRQGQPFTVETPDHIAGNIEFAGGAIGTILTSFATVAGINTPRIVVFGTEATLDVPDPNGFDGVVKIRKPGKEAPWEEVPHTHRAGYGRSVGVADMAAALRSGRAHRASGEQCFAVLDMMHGFLDAAREGRAYDVKAAYQRPAALPTGLPAGLLDQ